MPKYNSLLTQGGAAVAALLPPGEVGYSFGGNVYPPTGAGETYEALNAGQAGLQFSIPPIGGSPFFRTVSWQTKFTGGTPSAVNIVLQGAMEDIDGDYQTIDTSTNTAGEARTFANVQFTFLRVKLVSFTHSSETGLVAKILA